jgi:hypothetical protein
VASPAWPPRSRSTGRQASSRPLRDLLLEPTSDGCCANTCLTTIWTSSSYCIEICCRGSSDRVRWLAIRRGSDPSRLILRHFIQVSKACARRLASNHKEGRPMHINPMRVAATLIATGAIAGGGAALASAATGSTSTTPRGSTPTTATPPSTAKAPSGTKHHCPGMSGSSRPGAAPGTSGSSRPGAAYAPGAGQTAAT